MQRTTVRLPDDLLDSAKRHARSTGRSLTHLLEDAIRAELAARTSPSMVAESAPPYSVVTTYSLSSELRPVAVNTEQLLAQVLELQAFLGAIPDRDQRSADEILRYNAHGLPE